MFGMALALPGGFAHYMYADLDALAVAVALAAPVLSTVW